MATGFFWTYDLPLTDDLRLAEIQGEIDGDNEVKLSGRRRLRRVLAAGSAGVGVVLLLGCSSPMAPTTRQAEVTTNASVRAAADATCVSIGPLVQPPASGGTFSVA